jgi:putative phosphoribosyl transferase
MADRPPPWTKRHQAGGALVDGFADRQAIGHDTTLLTLMP